ncbi:programmed cell death 1 ligand 1-like [Archocentrus centrarchus]|uniref:programmed cell death 1 ligand 1-like n=1 Tax=Archocentrus centrarchus TaxID=63155 RepID=UPI0011EA3738|nr:programmed cell death 1 ligand 1-like [Archocentrus centrarchus]
MDAGKSGMLCWILLFVFFPLPTSAEQKTITAESGQDVPLTCRAPKNKNKIIVVEWSRADLDSEYVLLYRDEQFAPEEQHPSFKDRVDLQDRQMKDGDVSLILKDVTTADSGTYQCRVVLGDKKHRSRAHLKTHPIITINLRVAPPGPGGSVGLIVGLSVAAVLLIAAVIGLLIYIKKQKKKNQDSNQPNAEV